MERISEAVRRTDEMETTVVMFDDVFRTEFEPVVRLVFTITNSNSAAQDAAQEAFLTLFAKWDSVTNPAGFVRTVAINHARDRGRRSASYKRKLRLLSPAAGSTADMIYLADALQKLPHKRRAMIVLRFYEQCSIDEIAEILELPAGTVKSGLSRGLAQLRKDLT